MRLPPVERPCTPGGGPAVVRERPIDAPQGISHRRSTKMGFWINGSEGCGAHRNCRSPLPPARGLRQFVHPTGQVSEGPASPWVARTGASATATTAVDAPPLLRQPAEAVVGSSQDMSGMRWTACRCPCRIEFEMAIVRCHRPRATEQRPAGGPGWVRSNCSGVRSSGVCILRGGGPFGQESQKLSGTLI